MSLSSPHCHHHSHHSDPNWCWWTFLGKFSFINSISSTLNHCRTPFTHTHAQIVTVLFSMAAPNYKFTHMFSVGCVVLYVLSLSASSLLFNFKFCKIRGPICYFLQNQKMCSTGRQFILLPGLIPSRCSSNLNVPLNHQEDLLRCRFWGRAWEAAFLLSHVDHLGKTAHASYTGSVLRTPEVGDRNALDCLSLQCFPPFS